MPIHNNNHKKVEHECETIKAEKEAYNFTSEEAIFRFPGIPIR